jgi:predicted enzyme related to lactoylglutathione lyase
MNERDGYIPGVPCWADTTQPDPDAAARFYSGLFGWEIEDVLPAGAPGRYLIGRIRGRDVAAISSVPEGAPAQATWNTYVSVDSADDAADKVRAAGGRVLMEPMDVTDAGRMAAFADPEGAAFLVWQSGGHRGSQLVNESGSVSFNVLNTRDSDAADAFYGAVFGWQPLGMGGGDAWRLPGYGDHLEAAEPGLRERMAQSGAPAGFEDVVAALAPLGDEQGDVPAHWSITFAVDDVHASAEKAARLGGRVLVPPFDAPWVRSAVIADPQGATFTVSTFVPENRDLARSGNPTAAAA